MFNTNGKDVLHITVKFNGANKGTHFTMYGGKTVGVYSYNAIMNEYSDCAQFISISNDSIYNIDVKAMENNKECEIIITNPHNLVGFIINDPSVSLHFEGLNFCIGLKYFSIKNTDCQIRINDLDNCKQLRRLELDGTKCASNISSLINFEDLSWVSLNNTRCIGIISSLSKVNKLWRFSAINSSIRGSINDMHCQSIGSLNIDGTKCHGDANKFIEDNPELEELRMTDFYYYHTIG